MVEQASVKYQIQQQDSDEDFVDEPAEGLVDKMLAFEEKMAAQKQQALESIINFQLKGTEKDIDVKIKDTNGENPITFRNINFKSKGKLAEDWNVDKTKSYFGLIVYKVDEELKFNNKSLKSGSTFLVEESDVLPKLQPGEAENGWHNKALCRFLFDLEFDQLREKYNFVGSGFKLEKDTITCNSAQFNVEGEEGKHDNYHDEFSKMSGIECCLAVGSFLALLNLKRTSIAVWRAKYEFDKAQKRKNKAMECDVKDGRGLLDEDGELQPEPIITYAPIFSPGPEEEAEDPYEI